MNSALLIILIFAAGVVAAGLYWLSSRSGTDKVIDVRKTPERQVEDLTVEEFHELARDYLTGEGYVFEDAGEGYYLASSGDELFYVRIDPAAELRDPRTMNQLILDIRESDADRGLIVSTRAIKGQSYSLAQRTDTLILTPEDLVDDEREL